MPQELFNTIQLVDFFKLKKFICYLIGNAF